MDRIYCYLYAFFSMLPAKKEASQLAATWTALVPLLNIMAAHFTLAVYFHYRSTFPNGKAVVVAFLTIAWIWSYRHYHRAGHGKRVVSQFLPAGPRFRDGLIGSCLIAEPLAIQFLPLAIAQLRK
jgi:hypothetical protein